VATVGSFGQAPLSTPAPRVADAALGWAACAARATLWRSSDVVVSQFPAASDTAADGSRHDDNHALAHPHRTTGRQ